MLVYPSRSEGFGYPPLEAMAAGVPVVASRAGSVPEVCGGAADLVPPGDPVALARAMGRMRDDAAWRARHVALGRERARAFPVADAARRLWAVLEAAREVPCRA
jgi:glycosyltransferase involved in cell wall biosynthesis